MIDMVRSVPGRRIGREYIDAYERKLGMPAYKKIAKIQIVPKTTLGDLAQSANSQALHRVRVASSCSLEAPILKGVSRAQATFKTIWHAAAGFALFNSFPDVFTKAKPNTPHVYFGYTAEMWNRAFQFLKYLGEHCRDDEADLDRLAKLEVQKPVYYNDPSLQTSVSTDGAHRQATISSSILLAEALSDGEKEHDEEDVELMQARYNRMMEEKGETEDEDEDDEKSKAVRRAGFAALGQAFEDPELFNKAVAGVEQERPPLDPESLKRYLIRMARKCNVLYEKFNTDVDSKVDDDVARVSGMAEGFNTLAEEGQGVGSDQSREDQAFWQIMRDIGTVGVDLPSYADSCAALNLDPQDPQMPDLGGLTPKAWQIRTVAFMLHQEAGPIKGKFYNPRFVEVVGQC